MVVPKYIDEILNEVQYGNDEKSSCRMEEVETILNEDHWTIVKDILMCFGRTKDIYYE
jgi:hypothetical protein